MNSCNTDYFNVWLNFSQTFEGNDNNYQVKKNTLQPGVVAILIRVRPTVWYDKPCMRLEVYGEPDLEIGNWLLFYRYGISVEMLFFKEPSGTSMNTNSTLL